MLPCRASSDEKKKNMNLILHLVLASRKVPRKKTRERPGSRAGQTWEKERKRGHVPGNPSPYSPREGNSEGKKKKKCDGNSQPDRKSTEL